MARPKFMEGWTPQTAVDGVDPLEGALPRPRPSRPSTGPSTAPDARFAALARAAEKLREHPHEEVECLAQQLYEIENKRYGNNLLPWRIAWPETRKAFYRMAQLMTIKGASYGCVRP